MDFFVSVCTERTLHGVCVVIFGHGVRMAR